MRSLVEIESVYNAHCILSRHEPEDVLSPVISQRNSRVNP